jgi:hypothetical protein
MQALWLVGGAVNNNVLKCGRREAAATEHELRRPTSWEYTQAYAPARAYAQGVPGGTDAVSRLHNTT